MKPDMIPMPASGLLGQVAAYGMAYRDGSRPLHPTAAVGDLRQAFCTPLPQTPSSPDAAISALIAAAEPGLVATTAPNFYAWVMGASDPVGVCADMLTSIWGQNAAIYQTSPAAAIAEEAVASWLLELLDLPRSSSVGFVTGATMASFVGLAAARSEVLRRAGYDLEANGLAGAPSIRVFLSDDAHVTNYAALRYLGFGQANICPIASDEKGLMRPENLARALKDWAGPKIVIGQAGHINSGGFEDFAALSNLAAAHGAWLHVDGAFGLWARVLPEKDDLTRKLDMADSWSVDGHKWLQLPYDSGFAIVRDPEAHRRAMDFSAGYLNVVEGEGRNPTSYNPELSRRARGFAAWATLRALGKHGVQDLVRGHCDLARNVAIRLKGIEGLGDVGIPDLNQITLRCTDPRLDADLSIRQLAERLNATGKMFVRTATWREETILRLSFIGRCNGEAEACDLADAIHATWSEVREYGKSPKLET